LGICHAALQEGRLRSHPASVPHETASIRTWFDLARAGNFPSVASNVLAAFVLSSSSGMNWPAAGLLLLAIAAGCLIYAGGATFNDVADAAFDARHRPERAIPRGAVTREAAAGAATVEIMAGAGLFIVAGASARWVGVLILTILLYDWIHKRWAGSVVLMAGCRVLLALAVATLPGHGVTTPLLWWLGALFVYICTLSMIARREHRPGASGLAFGRAVGRLLAYIPFVDAAALVLVGAWIPAMVCALAVPLGRWTQRLAAST
jgi:4-hydroxybenzoate polyprenyltransferase